eukprot:768477-Hanusia_phi.AAC.3
MRIIKVMRIVKNSALLLLSQPAYAKLNLDEVNLVLPSKLSPQVSYLLPSPTSLPSNAVSSSSYSRILLVLHFLPPATSLSLISSLQHALQYGINPSRLVLWEVKRGASLSRFLSLADLVLDSSHAIDPWLILEVPLSRARAR